MTTFLGSQRPFARFKSLTAVIRQYGEKYHVRIQQETAAGPIEGERLRRLGFWRVDMAEDWVNRNLSRIADEVIIKREKYHGK